VSCVRLVEDYSRQPVQHMRKRVGPDWVQSEVYHHTAEYCRIVVFLWEGDAYNLVYVLYCILYCIYWQILRRRRTFAVTRSDGCHAGWKARTSKRTRTRAASSAAVTTAAVAADGDAVVVAAVIVDAASPATDTVARRRISLAASRLAAVSNQLRLQFQTTHGAGGARDPRNPIRF